MTACETFGGGTPALASDRIGEIIEALKEHFEITDGIGIEMHPENVNTAVPAKLKACGVTRISIGIQSFQKGAGLPKGNHIVELFRNSANRPAAPFGVRPF